MPVVKLSVICVNSCNARNEIWPFSKWLAIYSYLFNQYSTPKLEGTIDHYKQKKFRLRAADFPHFHDENRNARNGNARNTNVMHITALILAILDILKWFYNLHMNKWYWRNVYWTISLFYQKKNHIKINNFVPCYVHYKM